MYIDSRATNNNFAQGKLPIFANKGATILQIELNNANISDTLDRVHSVLSDANKLVRLRLGGNDLSGMLIEYCFNVNVFILFYFVLFFRRFFTAFCQFDCTHNIGFGQQS